MSVLGVSTRRRVMNLLVLGASGRTGREVVTQALGMGHRVRAFVHDPTKITVADPNLTVIAGDAMIPADLRSALVGQDAVVSTLGSHRVADSVISTTTETLVEAMGDTGVRRVVTMSSYVVAPNYRPSRLDQVLHPTDRTFAADMATGEALLRDSGLDWTILRATRLQNGPHTGDVRILRTDEPVSRRETIIRADVAEYLLELLGDVGSIRQVVMVTGER